MLTSDELYGGRDVVAVEPHHKALLRHLQLSGTLRDSSVSGGLEIRQVTKALDSRDLTHLDDTEGCLHTRVGGERVELPIVEIGLHRLAWLQHVTAAHSSAHP